MKDGMRIDGWHNSEEVMITYDRRQVKCRRAIVIDADTPEIVRGVYLWSPRIYQARRLYCEG